MNHIKYLKRLIVILFLSFFSLNVFSQSCSDYLVLKVKTESDPVFETLDHYAYYDTCGNEIIPFYKYPIIYTDTFRTMAIVLVPRKGFMAIDRDEKELFKIFPFDNGPDYISDGLIRIVENGKIGYANMDGQIIIPAQYSCAYPFQGGRALVSIHCQTYLDGEHRRWISDSWYYINNQGSRVDE